MNTSHCAAACALRDAAKQIECAMRLLDTACRYMDPRESDRFNKIHGQDVLTQELADEIRSFAERLMSRERRAG